VGLAVLDLLTGLVNKSLVVAERKQGQESRYDLLETIRHYALAKLATSSEADTARRRHATYYLALAELDDPAHPSINQLHPGCPERMEREIDNFAQH
jgi:predicted ATPase